MELCAGFTSEQWRTELRPNLDADNPAMWDKAIGVFERRMRERFFRCIDMLLKADDASRDTGIVRPGFSIMALCCLLVETFSRSMKVDETPTRVSSPNPARIPPDDAPRNRPQPGPSKTS